MTFDKKSMFAAIGGGLFAYEGLQDFTTAFCVSNPVEYLISSFLGIFLGVLIILTQLKPSDRKKYLLSGGFAVSFVAGVVMSIASGEDFISALTCFGDIAFAAICLISVKRTVNKYVCFVPFLISVVTCVVVAVSKINTLTSEDYTIFDVVLNRFLGLVPKFFLSFVLTLPTFTKNNDSKGDSIKRKELCFSSIAGGLFAYGAVESLFVEIINDAQTTHNILYLTYIILGVLVGIAVVLRQKKHFLIALLAVRFVIGATFFFLESELCTASFVFDIVFAIYFGVSHRINLGNAPVEPYKTLMHLLPFLACIATLPILKFIFQGILPSSLFYFLIPSPLPYLFLTLWMTTLILPETEDAPISESLFGDADRIEEYKRLLDDGVITEEEYERIKRQILSLK